MDTMVETRAAVRVWSRIDECFKHIGDSKTGISVNR